MGRLRDQMQKEMELRNYSPRTIQAYMRHMVAFTRLFRRSPAEMGDDQIREYLHHLRTVRKVSSSNINIAYFGLKFFYVYVLHRDWHVEKIPRPKKEKSLPTVLSRGEVTQILGAVRNLKHRVILMAIYSSGLRLSEATHLRIADIDSQRMQIRVQQGKGKKDRYTLLSNTLIHSLRVYYRAYHPRVWLFPGSNLDTPIGATTVQIAFRRAKKKSASSSRPPFTLYATASPPIS